MFTDPKASFAYVKDNPGPGHECLNFFFDKKRLDTPEHVHGYAPWTHGLPTLDEHAAVFFYTRNTTTKENLIVGVYGNAKVLNPSVKIPDNHFVDGFLRSNIRADRKLSLLF